MIENGRHSLSSLPIVSRLDHLDLIIKNIERQQSDPKWRYENVVARGRSDGPPPFLPLDAAVRDTYFKGSLLERVAALENRLFQLCLELESSSTSSTSTGGSGGESSSQRTKRDFLRTLPTFNNVIPTQVVPRQHPQNPVVVNNAHKSEIQEMGEKEQERKKEKKGQKTKQENEKKQRGNCKDEHRTCKTNKKKSPYKWSHFKMLGC